MVYLASVSCKQTIVLVGDINIPVLPNCWVPVESRIVLKSVSHGM